MVQTLQVTKTLIIVPLVTLQSSDFQEWYRHGVWWSLHEREGHGPLEDTYFPQCFIRGIERRAYTQPNTCNEAHDVAFFLGMIHGGVLTEAGTISQGVTTLVQLQDTNCIRGYHAGREFFFTVADTPKEWNLTEDIVLEWIHDLLRDYTQSPDSRDVYFAIGDLLGQLSGHLFPWTSEEQRTSDTESLRVCGYVPALNPTCKAATHRLMLHAVS